MLILAIDTALGCCAAAILETGTASVVAQESLTMQRGHAEALMPLIERVMNSSGQRFAALDRIVVTTGPGSFTGLRVGISAARGIALAAGKPAVGVTTLAAYAAPLLREKTAEPILTAIDARHGQIFFQANSGNGSLLARPCLVPIEEAMHTARFGAPRIVGNAAALLAQNWPTHGYAPALVDQQAAPDIISVAWLGAAANPETSPPTPFYLRAPDAKPKSMHKTRPL